MRQIYDKDRIHTGTLMMAPFYDLTTETDFSVPTQPRKPECVLLALIQKCYRLSKN